jgi:peptidyl-prolyl cis-trans isomerase A (cyclophilin A)
MPIRSMLLAAALSAAACNRTPEPSFEPRETEGSNAQVETRREAEPAAARAPVPEEPPARVRLVREPTSPDPLNGAFELAPAVEGLDGSRPLLATIRTSLGEIHCTLDERRAPRTVANFVGLARGLRPFWDAREATWKREPYYDGTSFHRVIPGFMIQGGDRLGDGTGEVGYVIPDEVYAGARHDRAGLLCMANRGANTNGGQFFIMDGAAAHLDGGYTIFGRCEETDIVSRIARVPQGPSNRPITPVAIEAVTIAREPAAR